MAESWPKLMFERGKLKNTACGPRTDESLSKNKSVKHQVKEAIRLTKSCYYDAFFAANYGNIAGGQSRYFELF